MRNRDARVAGALYALSIIGGIFTLRYIPDKLIVPGDAAATAHAILANESLLRIGIAGELALGVLWLFVVLALYQLLKDVDRTHAWLMLILGGFMQVPLYFVNVVNYVGALMFARGETFLAPFSLAQRDAMAMLFLRLHHYEFFATLVFAGLWLFPFGILVMKSGFVPRVLGAWLIVNGFAWLAICFTGFLAPQFSDVVSNVTAPLLFGEFAITLWLLIVGAKERPPAIVPTASG